MTTDILAGAPVIVGVDGSPSSLAAVRLAAHEAAMRARPLAIMHAIDWPYIDMPIHSDLTGPAERGLRLHAEGIVDTAAQTATTAVADVKVRTDVQIASPAAALINASAHAALVVVGARGHSGIASLLVGSTAQQVAAHAHCPVIVTRGEASTATGPIVVGVDGAPASAPAIAFAFEEADLRATGLIAVHAWLHPVSRAPGDMLPLAYDVADTEQEEDRLLTEALGGWRDRHPDVDVEARLIREHTRRALVDASAGAQMLVVAARGHGRFTSLPLGSVSHAMISHAQCPVAVVRPGVHAAA